MDNLLPPIHQDLTNQRFGSLVAEKYIGRLGKEKRHSWSCKCDCGNMHTSTAKNLLGHSVTSCGCKPKRVTRFLFLTGMRFGKLTVLERLTIGTSSAWWRCKCDCGKETIVKGCNLASGGTGSCGCRRYETMKIMPRHMTHGMSGSTEYRIYQGAMNRCVNPKNNQYNNYGGRGIKFNFISFEQFYDELGARPSMEYSLDRIEVDGNYGPGNCRWATGKQQARNKRCDNCTRLKERICQLELKLQSLESLVTT